MRKLLGFLFPILMALPSGSQAQDKASMTSDETMLHITATGSVRSRPDRIVINVPVQKSGTTALAARAAGQVAIERLKAALISAGITPTAVVTRQPGAWGFPGNETFPDFSATENDGEDGAVSQKEGVKTVADALRTLNGAGRRTANSLVEIRLTDAAQIAKVTPVLDNLDLPMAGVPQRSLIDSRIAKSAAIADALKQARAEADIYAQALGFTIVRITRVSNECPAVPNDYRAMMTGWAAMWSGQDGDMVETQATACVDFVVAPK